MIWIVSVIAIFLLQTYFSHFSTYDPDDITIIKIHLADEFEPILKTLVNIGWIVKFLCVQAL